jgi:hypothetical protein
MSNHFHLLCEVPQVQELSEAELLERIQAGYGPARRQALGSQSFVESHFYNLKHKLGYQRRRPATRLTALGCADTLWVSRDLRVRTIA